MMADGNFRHAATNQRVYLRIEDESVFDPPADTDRIRLLEHLPAPALTGSVAHVLAYRERVRADEPVKERILPDGLPRLVFSFAAGRCTAHLVGPRTEAVELEFSEDLDSLSVQLRVGASVALFGVPAYELVNRCIMWEDFAAPTIRHLPERLLEAADDHGRLGILQPALASIAPRAPAEALARVRESMRILRSGCSPREAAARLGLGERRLQQLHRAYAGLSPRGCARLFRFHASVRALRGCDGADWSDLAAKWGFYDQAHLVNEFRQTGGLTPARLLRSISGSSNTPP